MKPYHLVIYQILREIIRPLVKQFTNIEMKPSWGSVQQGTEPLYIDVTRAKK